MAFRTKNTRSNEPHTEEAVADEPTADETAINPVYEPITNQRAIEEMLAYLSQVDNSAPATVDGYLDHLERVGLS